jgi:hypothetical protein
MAGPRLAVAVLLSLFVASCTDQSTDGGSTDGADIVVDVHGPSTTFDRRLLGTNVPAWIGPERLADPEFQAATEDSGASLLRMPGGSWSNWYDWAGCEAEDPERCVFIGSARPSDFIDFLQATDLPGMWTLSANGTAQSAAAAVAFFNGDLGDDRVIGRDREGVDWGTVGSWAALRESGGNADPHRIELWEFGNEVFGGRPESGGQQCAEFGWEEVWTCDGAEYVVGDAEHDGYLAIREAMLAVDPTIEVGAVGVGDPADWSDWGSEVIELAGDDLDFYVVHSYGFDESPSGDDAVRRPSTLWPETMASVRERLDEEVPVAVTEYNLVSFEAGDTEQTMTKAMNALFVADTIGQLAVTGVAIANQWNLANGTTGSGTDYGMISLDDGSRFPQYEAMEMWSRVGSELLPVEVGDDALRAYATRHEDGRLTLLVLNLSDEESVRTVRLSGASISGEAELTSVWTDDLAATTMSRDSSTVPASAGEVTVSLPSWSVNVLELAAP